MSCNPKFLKVLQSLYKDACVHIKINGNLSDKVFIRSGVKQDCLLSQLLFTLFIADIAQVIEKSPHSILLASRRISGLLFVYNLSLVARSLELCKELLDICNTYFELNGLEINAS